LFIARAESRAGSGLRTPRHHYAVAIGCQATFADRIVYADRLNLHRSEIAEPVGVHCRQCPRTQCTQRVFDALVR
ncbi:MAG: XRE family transcriptional regulator, partial [Alphaproteobacteria bacterium]